MGRVEAVLFASAAPVGREVLANVVGRECALDLLIADISAELTDRPYEISLVAGGWQFRTRPRHADALRIARGKDEPGRREMTEREALVLTVIAYMQPITCEGITRVTGREVSRDLIGRLHRLGLIARGPRSPEPGAPYTYVTAAGFLDAFGLDTLRDLPDLEAMQDAGLLQDGGDLGVPVGEE